MILQRLRQETASYHKQIEGGLDIFDEYLTLAKYTNILANFLGFYLPVEQMLGLPQAGEILQTEVAQRRKTPLLLQDLCALGVADMQMLLTCTDLPRLENVFQALGCMYVLEGATLGGQIIARHVQRTLHVGEKNGCAFFNGYGCDTGRMWKLFGHILVTHVTSAYEEDVVIFSACETFKLFHRWLLLGVSNGYSTTSAER